MKRARNLTKILISLLSLVAISCISCKTVEVKDVEWCGDKVSLGARCTYALSGKTRNLNKEEWDAIRFGRISADSEGYTNWKTAIETLCQQTKKCDYQTMDLIIKNMDSLFYPQLNDNEQQTNSLPE